MQGSCLCKQVQYEVDALATPILHCSCQSCRKAHAAAFNTGAGVEHDHFRWLDGEDNLSSYESSAGKHRYFCKTCGSQLISIKEDAPLLILRVATLDDDPGVQPEFRIWKSHEVSWLNYSADIPEYDEWHPEQS
ncbi:aldehyde-activating protein [Methylophaga sp. 41_12_T18]|mgnify:FL=1|nr:aldehyde-activating protein [Methylophaga sp. 41_12_T18]